MGEAHNRLPTMDISSLPMFRKTGVSSNPLPRVYPGMETRRSNAVSWNPPFFHIDGSLGVRCHRSSSAHGEVKLNLPREGVSAGLNGESKVGVLYTATSRWDESGVTGPAPLEFHDDRES